MPTEEESKWEEAAKAYDRGKGLPLEEYDPDDSDDMVLLYDALEVNDPYAKKRLKAYIRRLRKPKEERFAESAGDAHGTATQREERKRKAGESEKKLNFVYDYVLEKKEEEATVALSKPKVSKYQRAVQNIGVVIDAPIWENSTLVDEFKRLGSAMAPFSWGLGKEDCLQNRRLYLAYLRNNQNIGLPPESKLFDGIEDSDLLSTNFELFGVKTKGNIDLVLAHKRHRVTATTRHHMWAGIELKKQDNKSDNEILRQVVLQHLSASYNNANTGILTIMTDLGPRWHFYWFSKEMNRLMAYHVQSKGEANYLIRHMMVSSGSASAPTSVPIDFLNRASWNVMFPQHEDAVSMEQAEDVENPEEGGDQDSNRTSSSSKKRGPPGCGEQQKRQSTAAGGNNVVAGNANFMAYSLDFMDEEEEKEARFRDVLEHMLPQLGVFPHRDLGYDHYAEGPPSHIGVS